MKNSEKYSFIKLILKKAFALAGFSAIIASLLFSTACDDAVTANRKIVFPDSSVSFQEHVLPFFQLKCAYQGCHSDFNPAANRPMTSYYNIMFENPGLVAPGKPDQSILIQIVEFKLPHLPYFPEDYFSGNHVKGLRTWIEEGAENN